MGQSGTPTKKVTATSDANINGILEGSAWNHVVNGQTVLTWSEPTSSTPYSSYSSKTLTGVSAVTTAEDTNIRGALADWSAVSNLVFNPITETSTTHADLRFAQATRTPDSGSSFFGASGSWPDHTTLNNLGGDTFFHSGGTGAEAQLQNTQPGSWGNHVARHEIGHDLGLKHAFDTNSQLGATGATGVAIPAGHDSWEYTIMTYHAYSGAPNYIVANRSDSGSYAQSLMMDDIKAIQYLYGANFNTHSGDTRYTFDPNTGQMFIDGVGQGSPLTNKIFRTIWDGGGNDTYDLSNYTTNMTIDLRPEHWSTFSTAQLADLGQSGGGDLHHAAIGNLANAALYQGDTRSLIENAIGGSGKDTITGNEANNSIWGGIGNDVIHGGDGNDTLYGGMVSRTQLRGSDGNDVIFGDAGNDTIKVQYGNDVLHGGDDIDTLSFAEVRSDLVIDLAAGKGIYTESNSWVDPGGRSGGAFAAEYKLTWDGFENLTGGSGNDKLTGDGGKNVILGGAGNDVIHGGDGNDILSGGFATRAESRGMDGSDELFGDAGNDTFKVAFGDLKVHGGADNDTLSFADLRTNVVVDLAAGSTTYNESGSWVDPNGLGGGGFAGLYKVTWDGVENVTGGSGNDTITGDGGANILVGNEGNDTIHGGGGDDIISGGFASRADANGGFDGKDELFGDAGNDTFKALFGSEKVHGGADNDTLSFAEIKSDLTLDLASGSTTYGDGGQILDADGNVIGGFGGRYSVTWDGIESLTGGSGKDNITGDAGANVLIGNGGDDIIHGGGGNDIIWGGVASRADSRGDDGNDVIFGDAGDDTINVLFGNKEVHGGADNDTLSFAAVTTNLVLDLAAGSTTYSEGGSWAAPDGLSAGGFAGRYRVTWDGVENLTGGSGKDNITGDAGANVLIGNGGDDVIRGGDGNDIIWGGVASRADSRGNDGNDVIFGDAGDDTINVLFGNKEVHGGADNDTLSFAAVTTNLVLDLAAGSTTYTEGGSWAAPDGLSAGGFAGMYRVTWDGVENLTGGSGSDSLKGDAQNNKLDGGAGDDTAVFGGKRSDYQITVVDGKTAVITDLRAGQPDGKDTITNIEHVKFADGTVNFGDLKTTPAPVAGSVSIGDKVITEGANGSHIETFTVTRTGGAAAFDVNFATKDGSATTADGDYAAQTGKVHFDIGVNTQTVSIVVNGDTRVEANETFTVNLSGATNGARIADGQGVGTIVNDDVAPVAGSVSIGDKVITEGNNGSHIETFTVTRTGGSAAFDVNFATADGSATTADGDYAAKTGKVHFDAGVNTQTISIVVSGDTRVEADETFKVNLSAATNGATIADGQGVGTIVNDDVATTHHVANDFNGDGISDVLFRNSSGSVAIWELNGNHIDLNATVGSAGNNWHEAGIGDFNGDGKADLLWQNDQGGVAMWQMDGNHIASNTTVGSAGSDWKIVDVADFSGDGKADILWENSQGKVAMWQMNGDHIASNTTVGSLGTDWHLIGTDDFNGDGKADILWENSQGKVAMWQMDGDHIASNTTVSSVGSNWHAAGTGDFNGDGKADVLWQNDQGGVAMWQMNGDHIASNTTVGSAAGWSVISTGDYNHDGKADVLWQNASGNVAEWQMDGDHIAANLTVGSHSTDWHAV